MNERQRRFCSEYVKDRDAPRAAAAAGYTGADAARRLLARGDIRAAIAAADADANDAEDAAEDVTADACGAAEETANETAGPAATHDEVLAFLSSVMRGTARDTIVIQNKRKIQYTESDGSKINDEETMLEFASVPPRLSEAMAAADKLHRYYASLGTDEEEGACGIVILPKIELTADEQIN